MELLVASSSAFALLVTLACCRETIVRETVKKQRLRRLSGQPVYLDEELRKASTSLRPHGAQRAAGFFSRLSRRGFKASAKKTERNLRLANELRLGECACRCRSSCSCGSS